MTVSVATVMLIVALLAAMTEEFDCFHSQLKRASTLLVKNRTCRNAYICVFIGIIFIATIINSVSTRQ